MQITSFNFSKIGTSKPRINGVGVGFIYFRNKMIYVEITEDSFIDAMNLAHTSKGHGFSDDGLKALFKYFSDEYFADYFELDPTWTSREFMEIKNPLTILEAPFLKRRIQFKGSIEKTVAMRKALNIKTTRAIYGGIPYCHISP
jgi:hypothetical protein